MTVTVTYNPTSGDLLRAAFVGLRSRRLVFALGVGFFVIVPWLAGLGGIVASELGVPIKTLPILSLIAIPLVTVAGFALIVLSQVRGARSLQGTHTYEFSDADIRLRGPGFDSRMEWALLTRCHASRHGLLFMSGNAPLISVPGRLLTSSLQNELQQLVGVKGIEVTGRWKEEAKQNASPDARKNARG